MLRRLRAQLAGEAYILIVLALGMITSMGIAVYVSNANTDRAVKRMVAIERQRQTDEQAKEAADEEKARLAAEAGRAASCRVIVFMAEAYAKDPPEVRSETYENVKAAWADLAKFC